MKHALLVLLLALTACDPRHGTGTGNPLASAPATSDTFMYTMVNTACTKIASCHADLSVTQCQELAWPLEGFAVKLGVTTTPAPTASELRSQEFSLAIRPNSLFTNACLNEISSLTCADPVVENAFDSEAASPLAGAPALLGPSCNGVFSP